MFKRFFMFVLFIILACPVFAEGNYSVKYKLIKRGEFENTYKVYLQIPGKKIFIEKIKLVEDSLNCPRSVMNYDINGDKVDDYIINKQSREWDPKNKSLIYIIDGKTEKIIFHYKKCSSRPPVKDKNYNPSRAGSSFEIDGLIIKEFHLWRDKHKSTIYYIYEFSYQFNKGNKLKLIKTKRYKREWKTPEIYTDTPY